MLTHRKVASWIATGKLTPCDGCWEWQGCYNSDGYPKVSWKGNANGKGHRVIYMIFNPTEDISDKVIRHVCDNPKCMNPDHLLPGTSRDNVLDRVLKERSHNVVRKEEMVQVALLRADGMTYKEISSRLGITYKRVEYILKRKLLR